MRLFIAVDSSEEVKDYLSSLQSKLNNELARIKFVGKEQMHLTLKFLGEVEESRLKEIKDKLNQVKFRQLGTKLKGLGVFPNPSHINVVWVGLEDNGITKLQQDIDNSLLAIFRKDERFHPHITLGRVKFVKDKEKFVELLKKIKVEEKEFSISEFKLIKSTLTEQGPVYEVLESFVAKI